MRRILVLKTASGSGGTTVGRALAASLGLPFVELDAIHWQTDWVELDAEEFRRHVEPIVAREAWVIDGSYHGKLGDLVVERADTIIWIDLPRRVWLPRLVRRTLRRVVRREELWNGNRESIWNALVGRESLFVYALRTERGRRRRYAAELSRHGIPVHRLRTPREVDGFLRSSGVRPASDTRTSATGQLSKQ
jgi:adenylate kinase family enzyme